MRRKNYSQYAVLGLGRFGLSVVRTLSEYDVNILACDRDAARLHEAADYATHLIQTDVSDEGAMEKLGLGNFDVVVITMAEDFEACVIATMMAKEYGAKYVLVKARGPRQKKILESIGADEVILPEREMGVKTARKLASPGILDVLEDSDLYTIAEMRPLDEWVGKSLRQADIRRKHGITVLGILHGGQVIIPPPPDRVMEADDALITLTERRKR